MAVLPCKRILIFVLILVFLCCFSKTTLAARSLRVAQIDQNQKVNNNDDDLKVHGEEHFSSTDDLVAMDYTPASKKPPIHN